MMSRQEREEPCRNVLANELTETVCLRMHIMSEHKFPKYGSIKAVRIIYGMPTGETMEAARRRELSSGGRVVHPGNPDRACSGCGEKFGTKKEATSQSETE